MNLLNSLLKNLVVWVLPRPRFILAAALLSVIASIWLAAVRLEVRTDQLSLISTRLPLIAKSHMLDEFDFHGKTTFALVVRGPTQDRAIEFMNAIVAKIQADPEHFQEYFTESIRMSSRNGCSITSMKTNSFVSGTHSNRTRCSFTRWPRTRTCSISSDL